MFRIKKPAQPYRNTRILSSARQRAARLAFCTTYCSFHRKIRRLLYLLILYGRSASLAKLDRRRQGTEGDRDHVRGVAEQEEIQQQEEIKDESAGGKEEEIPSV